ncbi:MAG: glycosyltransferase family 39 protein [Planctomycetes bacterium]|nr:glycosyltransferase family 39 protein [Planctomycetota bacterium]
MTLNGDLDPRLAAAAGSDAQVMAQVGTSKPTTVARHRARAISIDGLRRPAVVLDFVVLLVLSVYIVWARSHAFTAPLDPDEANYAYIASRLAAGDRLYVDIWDHQPPLVFALYGAVQYFVGTSEAAYRGVATAFSLGTLFLIFGLMRAHHSRAAAISAALMWALVNADPGTEGDGANREIYMNTCAVAGAWLMLHHARKTSWPALGLAGLAIGIASAFKPVLAILWALFVPWLVWHTWRRTRKRRRRRALLRAILIFGAGPVLVWLAQFVYFLATGRAGAFVEAVFGFNLGYVQPAASAGSNRLFGFFTARLWTFKASGAFWWSGLAGLIVGRWRSAPNALVRLLCAAAFIEVVFSGFFWRHYYHLMLPPLAMAIGMLVARTLEIRWRRGCSRSAGLAVRLAAVLGLGVLSGWTLAGHARWYFAFNGEQLSFLRYGVWNIWSRQLGLMVADLTRESDYIYQYGELTGVYQYSRRRTPSKYTMVRASLVVASSGREQRRAELIADLHEQPVRLIVVTQPPFEALDTILQYKYHLIADARVGERVALRVYASNQDPLARAPLPEAWMISPSDFEELRAASEIAEQNGLWK